MSTYKPPLVIVAPKGEAYSSISDETFEVYKSRPWFMGLTFQQYCAWAITVDKVRCNSTKVYFDPAPVYRQFEWDVEVYAERLQDGNTVIKYPGMAPGWFNARRNDYAWFSVPTSIQNSFVGVGSTAVLLLNEAIKLGIKPFYHRDKFYLVWDSDPRPPTSGTTYSFNISSTRLYFEILDGSSITKYEFNLGA
jgi:hypothetical protein